MLVQVRHQVKIGTNRSIKELIAQQTAVSTQG